MVITAPVSCAELLSRAHSLCGLSIEQLAVNLGVVIPQDFKHNKGWVGQLLEIALGANAGVKAEPDFPHLGIELKTIPVNSQGKVLESTYITTVPLMNAPLSAWEESVVYQKLKQVLWLPLITTRQQNPTQRLIGKALLWQPSATQAAMLQQDWQELMEMVCCGELEQITAHLGTYLQIRPKAANAKALSWGINEEGEKILTLPRGFYLRPSFTSQIINLPIKG